MEFLNPNVKKTLYDSTIDWSILRFASVQGWVPHRKTRNQQFLEKLANNVEINVDKGVLQNRILSSLLIQGVVDIIHDKVTGILHFGASDASEEYDFLCRQAECFGYNPASILQTDIDRNVNLVAIPGKMIKLYGKTYLTTEEETLKGLYAIEELRGIK